MLTLVVLAAGLSSRYGALKQLDAVGPGGHPLMDYAVYDARRAGFTRVVFVIRDELESQFADRVEHLKDWIAAEYVFQRLEDLPRGTHAAAGRTKPWGTGHAVLAVRERMSGPFAVVNADDFYGRAAFVSVHKYLSAAQRDPPTFAVVGFALRQTLSPHGGVSRGICEHDEDRWLRAVTELKELRDDGERITGVRPNGTVAHFTGDETVSTNFWGFTTAAFEMLQSQFETFLETHANDLDAEFLIPDAVNDVVATNQARVRILGAREQFFGVTHPGDKAHVQHRIHELVAQGEYPPQLFGKNANDR
jgi:hypothetical protein